MFLLNNFFVFYNFIKLKTLWNSEENSLSESETKTHKMFMDFKVEEPIKKFIFNLNNWQTLKIFIIKVHRQKRFLKTYSDRGCSLLPEYVFKSEQIFLLFS